MLDVAPTTVLMRPAHIEADACDSAAVAAAAPAASAWAVAASCDMPASRYCL
jgi:hypothetical protein